METTVQVTEPSCRMESEQDEDQTGSCVDDEMMDPLHSKIPKENVPRIGMEFESEDAAYEFYNNYALMVGFSVRKSSAHSYRGTLLDRTYVCSCQGKRGPDKREVYKSHRPETRCGCLARMKISSRHLCKFRVIDFVSKHNHELAGPGNVHLFRSHRKLSTSHASECDMADMPDIPPRNVYVFMAKQAAGGGIGSAGVENRNYLQGKRSSEMKLGDARVVLAYLQTMQAEDPGFFYAIQVDRDDMITNIFWTDARMMTGYEDFGDVVCFDTTCRKLKDGRPIVLFVGVNHHKQSTIFGAALMYDGTFESFLWLVDTFSRAMGGKAPKTMLTDEDDAISKALAFQWPETYHRLCVWQIFQNATIQLSDVFARYEEFPSDFSNCIFDIEHEEEFVKAWTELLGKYELINNDWLKRMFNDKEKWALVYGRDRFGADISATQRDENMVNFIKQYVRYEHGMEVFFEKFQQSLSDRRYDEMVADIMPNQDEVLVSFPVAILKHAASFYTSEVFQLFKDELCKGYDSPIEVCGEMGAITKYKVTPYKKHYSYVVSYDATQETVCCNCMKFEFSGLLCSHILKVFYHRAIREVPRKYILKRWTKNAKGVTNMNLDGNPKSTMGRSIKDLHRLSTRLITRASESEDGYNLVKEGLLTLLRKLDLKLAERTMRSKRPKRSMSRDGNSPCLAGNQVEQHLATSYIAQEKQNFQLDRSVPQQPIGFVHPWDSSG